MIYVSVYAVCAGIVDTSPPTRCVAASPAPAADARHGACTPPHPGAGACSLSAISTAAAPRCMRNSINAQPGCYGCQQSSNRPGAFDAFRKASSRTLLASAPAGHKLHPFQDLPVGDWRLPHAEQQVSFAHKQPRGGRGRGAPAAGGPLQSREPCPGMDASFPRVPSLCMPASVCKHGPWVGHGRARAPARAGPLRAHAHGAPPVLSPRAGATTSRRRVTSRTRPSP